MYNEMDSLYNDLLKNGKLSPEIDKHGNIEYKLKLINTTKERINELTTQMKWRMNEGYKISGQNIVIYVVGIHDNGTKGNILYDDIKDSIKTLKIIAQNCDSKFSTVLFHKYDKNAVAFIKIIQNETIMKPEKKILLYGKTNVGKSTLLSVLVHETKDDGKGSGRYRVLQHEHESSSGKTSCINTEILGSKNNEIITYNKFTNYIWENIHKYSTNIFTITDIPGDKKYEKSTIYGLLAYRPDYIYYIIDPSESKININENIKFLKNLKIPFTIIVNKIDMIKEKYNIDMPHIQTSCVTKKGIDELYKHIININSIYKPEYPDKDYKIFMINKKINVYNLGIILYGILLNGIICVNDELLIGPINGKYVNTKIKSIHKKQIPCTKVYANETASFVIDIPYKYTKNINKYKILISDMNVIKKIKTFNIELNDNINVMSKKYIIHINNTYNECGIEDKYKNSLGKYIYKITLTEEQNMYYKNDNIIILRDVQNNLVYSGNLFIT